MREIDRIASTGVVDVVAPLVWQKAIIAGIVDTLERKGRAQLVAFGRMIIDNVQNDFETMG